MPLGACAGPVTDHVWCALIPPQMMHHFHPSVMFFTRDLLRGEHVAFKGDPLQDFALLRCVLAHSASCSSAALRFLDRFSFKNPKALAAEDKVNTHGGSAMQVPRLTQPAIPLIESVH